MCGNIVWCRVKDCIHIENTGTASDKDGWFGYCTLGEVGINRDGVCEDRATNL